MADQEKSKEQLAQEAAAKAKTTNDRPQMPAASTPARDIAIGESTGNFTRDSIIEFQRAKFMESGKDEAEAQRLAVRRGFEMVRDEEPKK